MYLYCSADGSEVGVTTAGAKLEGSGSGIPDKLRTASEKSKSRHQNTMGLTEALFLNAGISPEGKHSRPFE
jgi:hypothetical protein